MVLLKRASYFPKLKNVELYKLLKARKLDNFFLYKVMKRFDRLWLQNIYPYIYKWLFLKKYKFYWRTLFLKFINFRLIDKSKKTKAIAQKFRNSWLNIKNKRLNDLSISKDLFKKNKVIKSKIDSSYHRLFSALLHKQK